MSLNLAHLDNKVKPFAKQSREHFSIIPNAVFEIGLDHYEVCVYVFMKRVAGESGQCWKSIPAIAKQLRISEMTVRRSIGKLLKRRLELGGKSLIRKVPSKHRSNTYVVEDIWAENSRVMRLRHPSTTEHSTPLPHVPYTATTEHSTPLPQNSKEDPPKKITKEDPFFKREKNPEDLKHERPSGLLRDPQFGDSAQADLSQADSYDEELVVDSHDQETAVLDDVTSFMPPPHEQAAALDWLLEDIKRF
jgi:hypothetical protein